MTQSPERDEHLDELMTTAPTPLRPQRAADNRDVLPILAALQDQIDQLTAAVEGQQDQIDRLRRTLDGRFS